jgi:hypothetical protein
MREKGRIKICEAPSLRNRVPAPVPMRQQNKNVSTSRFELNICRTVWSRNHSTRRVQCTCHFCNHVPNQVAGRLFFRRPSAATSAQEPAFGLPCQTSARVSRPAALRSTQNVRAVHRHQDSLSGVLGYFVSCCCHSFELSVPLIVPLP